MAGVIFCLLIGAMPVPGRTAGMLSLQDAGVTPGAKAHHTPAVSDEDPSTQAMLLNKTAVDLIRQGRATGDLSFFVKADSNCKQAEKLDPNGIDTLINRAWISTIFHQFDQALLYSLRALVVDDQDYRAYGTLCDAYYELGNYEKAAEAAQQMLDLKPGYASWSRGAQIRWIHGDTTGAMELMSLAAGAAPPRSEEMAWTRVQLADMAFRTGNLTLAADQARAALNAVPHYRHALAQMARLAWTEGKTSRALALYKDAVTTFPTAQMLVEYAELLELAHDPIGAQEQIGRATEVVTRSNVAGIAGDELVLAVAAIDRGAITSSTLQVLEKEATHHGTVQALSALAWAYHYTGRSDAAYTLMKQARRAGTRDPLLFYRAGVIAIGAGKAAEGKELLVQALALNPKFHPRFAHQAMQMLQE